MEVLNETPFAVRLLQLDRPELEVQAVLVVKSTFDLAGGARYEPSREQVPIVDDRLDTPFGPFHTDCFVRKEGVDIGVLGHVRLSRRVRVARVSLNAGSHRAGLTVTGDRTWTERNGRLSPSDPAPFTEMPISYARAYGGSTEHDYETVTWADNPIGRGHYLAKHQASGQPLPNVEPGDGPFIREWSDQPPVAGWAPYPFFWGVRAREGVDTVAGALHSPFLRMKTRLNNNAHPSLIVPKLDGDGEIRIVGLRERPIVIQVPRIGPVLYVDVGGRKSVSEGELDGVFIWVDHGRLTLTHRIHFAYSFRRGERRSARLALSSLDQEN